MPWLLSLEFTKRFGAWFICVFLLTYIVGLKISNNSLRNDLADANKQIAVKDAYIEQQNAGILQLKQAEAAEVKRIKLLEADIAKDQKRSLETTQAIMNADIPKECNKALEWGIGWVKKLKY